MRKDHYMDFIFAEKQPFSYIREYKCSQYSYMLNQRKTANIVRYRNIPAIYTVIIIDFITIATSARQKLGQANVA